jgi:transcriptional regulator with XRE-family HTH domain
LKRRPESIFVKQPEFSKWLINKRQGLNLSKADLIRITHGKISARTIKNLEAGRQTNFRENTLIELALALNLTFEELLNEIKKLSGQTGPLNISGPKSKVLKKYFFALLFLIPAFIVFRNMRSPSMPIEIKIYDDYFSVLDAGQNILFSKKIVLTGDLFSMSDINNDGVSEVVVGIKGYGNYQSAGNIIAFDNSGSELWLFHPFKGFFYEEGGHTDKYNPVKIISGHFLGNRTEEVIAAFREVHWSPSCIVTLDSDGKEKSRYWNPGVILNMVYNSKENLVFMHCVNNRLKEQEFGNDYPNCVALFKADDISGQAPPYNGNGVKKGSHLWYLEVKPNGTKVRGMDFVDYAGDGTMDVCFGVGKLTYYVDLKGTLLDTLPSDDYKGGSYDLAFHK